MPQSKSYPVQSLSYTPHDPDRYGAPPPYTNGRMVDKDKDGIDDEEEHRGIWGSKWEFLLSCIGLSVGIGNVWRFPYLCYDNGGAAFLIPYIIVLILVGKPMYYMELAFGQYGGEAPLTIWTCVPIAKGVGVAMVIVSLIVAIYYNVVMSYTLYYMWASMQRVLPWTTCDNEWNTVACYVRGDEINKNYTDWWNETDLYKGTFKLKTAPEEYWENKVLGLHVVTNGTIDHVYNIADLGGIKWDVVLNLLLSWIIVFACLMKGIKSSGKVVYFTATFPYVVLIILLIRGVTLEGAKDGIRHLFVPTWAKLKDVQVWRNALGQMFFSLSVGWGCLIMFASYNKFRHNCYKDAIIVSSLDTITSVIAGFVVFSVIGALKHDLGIKNIEDVVKGGPGLAFVAYPEAVARLPVAQLWSIIFFFMLYTLGLDSEFALLECVMSSLTDQFKGLRKHKFIFTLCFCIGCFLIALPSTTYGGLYVWALMDKYGGDFAVLLIAFFEIVALMWIYGFKQFCRDIVSMLGFSPGIYWLITWIVVSPVLILVVFILAMIDYKPLITDSTVYYPPWADGVGWFLAGLSLIQIPFWAIVMILVQKGNLSQKFISAITKKEEYDHRLRKYGPRQSQSHPMATMSSHSATQGQPIVIVQNPEKGAYDNPAMKY